MFTTPFLYNPANGPLLIDSKDTSLDAASGQFDVADCDPGSCATVNIYTSPIGSPTGRVSLTTGPLYNRVHLGEHRPLLDLQLRRDSFHSCGGSPELPGKLRIGLHYRFHFFGCSLHPQPAALTGVNFFSHRMDNKRRTRKFLLLSTDSAAAAELGSINGCTDMSFSTNSSGNIVDWCMGAGNAEFVGFTINPTFIGGSGLPIADTFLINPGMAQENVTTSTPGQWTETLNTLPTFFTGEVSLGSGVYYLQFPNGNVFGYYNFPSLPDLVPLRHGVRSLRRRRERGRLLVRLYQRALVLHQLQSLFPYLYDFTLNNWLYYFPATNNPGHYTTNPRYFSDLTTGKIITM